MCIYNINLTIKELYQYALKNEHFMECVSSLLGHLIDT